MIRPGEFAPSSSGSGNPALTVVPGDVARSRCPKAPPLPMGDSQAGEAAGRFRGATLGHEEATRFASLKWLYLVRIFSLSA